MAKEPLYPHKPKSKPVETPHRVEEWSPIQRFVYSLAKSITDEMDGYHSYRHMATQATALGENKWAATLEQMAEDEYKHHDRLYEMLKQVEIVPQTINRQGGESNG